MITSNKILISLLIMLPFLSLTACSQRPGEAEKLETEEEQSFHEELDSLTAPEPLDKDMVEVDSLRQKEAYEHSYFKSVTTLEDSLKTIYAKVLELNPLVRLDYKPFRYAMIGYYTLRQEDRLNTKNILTIIDFTKSSCEKRFYTINLDDFNVIFHSLVSHGRNTGGDMATAFSNERGSNASSLGFYVTGQTYTGSKGYSLRLHGDEVGWNDNMYKRAVVMHEASYVSEDFVKKYGRLGRSFGCPALPQGISAEVIDEIKGKTAIFAYYNDDKYLKASKYLNVVKLVDKFEQQEG